MTPEEIRQLRRDLEQPIEHELDPYAGSLWTRPGPELEPETPVPAPAAAPLALPLLRPLRRRAPQLGTLARDFWERLPRLTWWPCLTAASRCVAGIVRVRIRGRRKC